MLAINSEAFTYWAKNYKLVEALIEEASPKPSWLMTVRGTIHVNQSDFSILFPNVCSLVLKMTANPRRALDLNINASLEFLKMVMPGIPDRMAAAFPQEGLLWSQEAPLEVIPSIEQHRPRNELWTGGRLSIPHEFWWRVLPSAARKMARAKNKVKGRDSGHEVWIHRRPDEATVENYAANARGKSVGAGDPSSKVQPQSVPCNKRNGTSRQSSSYRKGQAP